MRLAALALLTCCALAPLSARAQYWPNETGLGGDLFASSSRQFDRLRAPPQPVLPAPLVAPASPAMPMARAPVPMLDWSPAPAAAPRAPARATTRRPTRRTASAAPRRTTAPAATETTGPTTTVNVQEWERRLSERERNLEALQRQLQEDRRFLQSQRGSASVLSAPVPVQQPVPQSPGGAPSAAPR